MKCDLPRSASAVCSRRARPPSGASSVLHETIALPSEAPYLPTSSSTCHTFPTRPSPCKISALATPCPTHFPAHLGEADASIPLGVLVMDCLGRSFPGRCKPLTPVALHKAAAGANKLVQHGIAFASVLLCLCQLLTPVALHKAAAAARAGGWKSAEYGIATLDVKTVCDCGELGKVTLPSAGAGARESVYGVVLHPCCLCAPRQGPAADTSGTTSHPALPLALQTPTQLMWPFFPS